LPAQPAKETSLDLNSLNLEVTALETLNQLKLTRSQLERLKKLAPMTVNKLPPPRAIKVSDEFQQTIKDLRTALLEDNEVQIADLSLALDELRDKENPDFDEVEITAGSRRHAAEVLRSLSSRQAMGYLSTFADEFPDPVEKMTDAFDEIRKLPDMEWQELRDEVAGQVGWLVAGLDPAAEKKVQDKVAAFLDRVHRLKPDEYTVQQAELEKTAQTIVGTVGPTEVIRHFMERSLAELLSNPRLAVAVEALVKKAD
jgi:protein-tyrosine-phosphatase